MVCKEKSLKLPIFDINKSTDINFDLFNSFMNECAFDTAGKQLATRCKMIFEGYIKAVGVEAKKVAKAGKLDKLNHREAEKEPPKVNIDYVDNQQTIRVIR